MTAPDDSPTDFSGLGLREELVTALGVLGYEEPTPIQREAIPPLLAGKDLLGQAATGTGKTAAFALPLLQGLQKRGRGSSPVSLVLAPTRELAMQVSEATHRYGKDLFGPGNGARVLPVYGGQPIGRLVSVDEVAEAIAYLASPLSSSTTATVLAVDGGMANLRLRAPGS